MKFMLMYRMKPDHRDAAVKRFQKTGGTAGEGVTILGRWHKAAAGSGWTLVESSSAKALADFAFAWSDLLELEAHPVVEDGELSQIFKSGGF